MKLPRQFFKPLAIGAPAPMRELPVRFVRGLRVRLMLSYVFFFTVLLIALGLLFRETLSVLFENEMQDTLKEEFGAVKLGDGNVETGPQPVF